MSDHARFSPSGAHCLRTGTDAAIHTADQLEEQIERSRKFYDIAGDALARLAALAAETL